MLSRSKRQMEFIESPNKTLRRVTHCDVYLSFRRYKAYCIVKKFKKFVWIIQKLHYNDRYLLHHIYDFLIANHFMEIMAPKYYTVEPLYYIVWQETPLLELHNFCLVNYECCLLTADEEYRIGYMYHKQNFYFVVQQLKKFGKREHWYGYIHYYLGLLNNVSRESYNTTLNCHSTRNYQLRTMPHEAFHSLMCGFPLNFMIYCVNKACSKQYSCWSLLGDITDDALLGTGCPACNNIDCFCELYTQFPTHRKFVVTNVLTPSLSDSYLEVPSDLGIAALKGFYVELSKFKRDGVYNYF